MTYETKQTATLAYTYTPLLPQFIFSISLFFPWLGGISYQSTGRVISAAAWIMRTRVARTTTDDHGPNTHTHTHTEKGVDERRKRGAQSRLRRSR